MPETDLAPTGGQAPAPTPITPAAPPSAGPSQELARPGRSAVAQNLSRTSWLDLLNQRLRELDGTLEAIGDVLHTLGQAADALDGVISNVDELSKHYEAPAATRAATDADSMICALIANLVRETQRLAFDTRMFNAQSFQGLAVMRDVQDSQRTMGAGPRLLQTANR